MQPKYIDLAGSGAQIRRALQADQYPRLTQVLPALGDGEAVLHFGLDEQGRSMVDARVAFDCAMQCQLCLEPQPRQVDIQFTTLLAADETQAEQWSQQLDQASTSTISVVGEDLDVAALVEDEVLLQLPSNVCLDDGCEMRPDLSYAPPGAGQNDGDSLDLTVRESPFAVLEQLKQT